MDDVMFQGIVDDVFIDIEDRVDALDADIDIDTSGGVLTLTMEDGSNIIFSRQIASHEIWVAAKSGGFHLRLADDCWHCGATEESLEQLVDRVFVEQSAVKVFDT